MLAEAGSARAAKRVHVACTTGWRWAGPTTGAAAKTATARCGIQLAATRATWSAGRSCRLDEQRSEEARAALYHAWAGVRRRNSPASKRAGCHTGPGGGGASQTDQRRYRESGQQGRCGQDGTPAPTTDHTGHPRPRVRVGGGGAGEGQRQRGAQRGVATRARHSVGGMAPHTASAGAIAPPPVDIGNENDTVRTVARPAIGGDRCRMGRDSSSATTHKLDAVNPTLQVHHPAETRSRRTRAARRP